MSDSEDDLCEVCGERMLEGTPTYANVAHWDCAQQSRAATARREPDTKRDTACEVVEMHAVAPPDGHVVVTLPLGHDVLADFLESIGLHAQAMALRGVPPCS